MSGATLGFEFNNKQSVLPSKGDKPKNGAMSDDEFVGTFRVAMQDAEEYIDGHIAPLRAAATRYSRGEPFGNEEHGRSQVVMTEVRDAVMGIMPSLLRIFTASDNVCEMVPTNAATIDLADQTTDYVNHVFYHDNPGFLILHSAFKDALYRKTGIVKWRWSQDISITETQFSGLTAEEITVLEQDKTVQILKIEENEKADPPKDALAGPQDPPTYDVHIHRIVEANRLIVEALPPEEYLVNRNARDPNGKHTTDWTLQAHRSYKTVSELVAMGFDQDEVIQNMGGTDMFKMNFEAQARNPALLAFMAQFDSPDDALRQVLFVEAYQRIDKDGDGIAEIRKIQAVGDAYHILHEEIVDEAPFAVFCADPEPHMAIGSSVADQTMDIQLMKSNMVRALLDSLAGSIHPRTVVAEGKVNLDDAMNTEQGAIIRAKDPSAVIELVKPFVGQQALPVIAYVDQIKSKRTGLTDASQGLDPQVLQSATHAAVTATVTGAQERIELYARILAETGMKRLMSGIAKALRENQDQPRVVKLRGQYVPVDPRQWVGDLEFTVNVALGKGTDVDKINFLVQVLQKQEQIMQVLGPTNPIAGLTQYRNTLGQLMTLAGYKDSTRYFGPVTPQYLQQLQQAAQNPPPNPQMMLAQAEVEKLKNEFQLKVAKFHQEQLEAFQKDQREREKMRMDAIIAVAAAEAKAGQDINLGMLSTMLEHEADLAKQDAEHRATLHGNMMQALGQAHQTQTQGQVDHAGNQMQAQIDDAHNQRLAAIQREAAIRQAQAKPAAGGE